MSIRATTGTNSIRVPTRRRDEADLQARILNLFGSMPEVRLFRANVGVATPIGRTHPVRFGVVGQADLNGIVAPSGRRLEIEVKTPTGRRTKEQVAWGEMVERFGGIYVVARSTDDVFVALAAAGVVLRFAPPGVARAVVPAGPASACPCLHATPCSPNCTCVNPASSLGCRRCCSFGSESQRRARAERLAGLIGGAA